MATAVGVVGSVIHAPRDAKQASLEEAMYAVTRSALLDAGLTIEDIDGIVVGANDQLDGRAISIMMASGSVGGVGRTSCPRRRPRSMPSCSAHCASRRASSGLSSCVSWSPLEVTRSPRR